MAVRFKPYKPRTGLLSALVGHSCHLPANRPQIAQKRLLNPLQSFRSVHAHEDRSSDAHTSHSQPRGARFGMSTIRSSREPRKGPQRAHMRQGQASRHKQAGISKQAMGKCEGQADRAVGRRASTVVRRGPLGGQWVSRGKDQHRRQGQ